MSLAGREMERERDEILVPEVLPLTINSTGVSLPFSCKPSHSVTIIEEERERERGGDEANLDITHGVKYESSLLGSISLLGGDGVGHGDDQTQRWTVAAVFDETQQFWSLTHHHWHTCCRGERERESWYTSH